MANDRKKLTPLEQAALLRFLGAEGVENDSINLESIEVTERSFSGVGFFTEVDRVEALRLFDRDVRGMRGEVRAVVGSPPLEVGFVFGCEDGYVTMIECYSYGEPFPEATSTFEILDDRDPATST